ncbi:MAG: hypothetical protein ACHP7N_01595 [Caulobacterales bacterium]
MKTYLKYVAAGFGLAVPLACASIVIAQENQPHMQSALVDLQSAKGELSVALHNKNGHRVNALNLVNQAIGEVQAGIAAGDN